MSNQWIYHSSQFTKLTKVNLRRNVEKPIHFVTFDDKFVTNFIKTSIYRFTRKMPLTVHDVVKHRKVNNIIKVF